MGVGYEYLQHRHGLGERGTNDMGLIPQLLLVGCACLAEPRLPALPHDATVVGSGGGELGDRVELVTPQLRSHRRSLGTAGGKVLEHTGRD